MSKILFLGVEGVLCDAVPEDEDDLPLVPGWLRELKRVLDETGARVVLTSPCRRNPRQVAVLREKGVLDCAHDDWQLAPETGPTGDLVRDWLARHPETAAYAVVDGKFVAMPERRAAFVMTEAGSGFSMRAGDRIVDILGTRHAAFRNRGPHPPEVLDQIDVIMADGVIDEDEAIKRSGMGDIGFRVGCILGHVVWLEHHDGTPAYPARQFDHPLICASLRDLRQALPPMGNRMLLSFLVRRDPRLGGIPIDFLAQGRLEEVIDAARHYGDDAEVGCHAA